MTRSERAWIVCRTLSISGSYCCVCCILMLLLTCEQDAVFAWVVHFHDHWHLLLGQYFAIDYAAVEAFVVSSEHRCCGSVKTLMWTCSNTVQAFLVVHRIVSHLDRLFKAQGFLLFNLPEQTFNRFYIRRAFAFRRLFILIVLSSPVIDTLVLNIGQHLHASTNLLINRQAVDMMLAGLILLSGRVVLLTNIVVSLVSDYQFILRLSASSQRRYKMLKAYGLFRDLSGGWVVFGIRDGTTTSLKYTMIIASNLSRLLRLKLHMLRWHHI